MTWFDVYLAASGVSVVYWGAVLLPRVIDYLPELQEHVSSLEASGAKKQMAVRMVHLSLVMVYLVVIAGLSVLWPLLVPVKAWMAVRRVRSGEPTCMYCDEPLPDDDEEHAGVEGRHR